MKKNVSIRALAAQICHDVFELNQSLSALLPEQQNNIAEKDRALLQELCFGVVRNFPVLELMLNQLMKKPFAGKQRVLHFLLLVGIYQLHFMRIPQHAAVNETVNAVYALKKMAFKNVINGVLREFLRQESALEEMINTHYHDQLHPLWLIERIKAAYPDRWQTILDANNQKAPIWLRVNPAFHTPESYLACLHENKIEAEIYPHLPAAIRLISSVAIPALPGFQQGWFSVQDIAAQTAAPLLAPQDNETILDLCAAPGGKTTHILELAPKANVTAVDVNPQRLKRINENLARLQQKAEVIEGDALSPENWIGDRQFDRILIDVPCSATGVIRRHPDIKWLKNDDDIAALVQTQATILDTFWRYLKPNGTLVYSTCSILPEENTLQIQQFLAAHPDAIGETEMRQFLPEINGSDGFFTAKLQKKSA